MVKIFKGMLASRFNLLEVTLRNQSNCFALTGGPQRGPADEGTERSRQRMRWPFFGLNFVRCLERFFYSWWRVTIGFLLCKTQ